MQSSIILEQTFISGSCTIIVLDAKVNFDYAFAFFTSIQSFQGDLF
jgi:hypothetical protein